jgi:hypothetical protein
MSQTDKNYFEQRAEAEIALACSATDGAVVRAHYELACAYLDRIYPSDTQGIETNDN